jgi:hypothetical protein
MLQELPVIHLLRGWVAPDVMTNRRIPKFGRNGVPVIQPKASNINDWALPTPSELTDDFFKVFYGAT